MLLFVLHCFAGISRQTASKSTKSAKNTLPPPAYIFTPSFNNRDSVVDVSPEQIMRMAPLLSQDEPAAITEVSATFCCKGAGFLQLWYFNVSILICIEVHMGEVIFREYMSVLCFSLCGLYLLAITSLVSSIAVSRVYFRAL